MALISGFNSMAWIIYSLLLGDYYILIPSALNIIVVIMHVSLFSWTIGHLETSSLLIRTLHRYCKGKVNLEILTKNKVKTSKNSSN
jgi:hypothetical protein